MPQPKPRPMHTIAIFPKIQIDTSIAVFLLYEFGEKYFPGISRAKLEFWTALPAGQTATQLESEGILPIDLGGGIFDHHHTEHGKKRVDSASTLIAKYLDIDKRSELKKLLAFARRDDLEGKGTISQDSLDRAFGLSGLVTAMGRVYPDEPQLVLGAVLPLLRAHYLEEHKRQVELPAEWRKMKTDGRGREEQWELGQKKLRVMIYESNNISLAGFLRAYYNADLIIQRFDSGHTNIVTNQKERLDLRPVIRELRRAEGAAGLPPEKLEAPGRIAEVPEWFFDTAANTLQNGGISPQDTPVTKLSLEEIVKIVRQAFNGR